MLVLTGFTMTIGNALVGLMIPVSLPVKSPHHSVERFDWIRTDSGSAKRFRRRRVCGAGGWLPTVCVRQRAKRAEGQGQELNIPSLLRVQIVN